jgi:hypothetical protein
MYMLVKYDLQAAEVARRLFKFLLHAHTIYYNINWSPSRRREAPCEGTNSSRLFTPWETKALAKSKVHQTSRAWLTNDVSVGGHPHWSQKYGGLSWIANTDWSNLKFAL